MASRNQIIRLLGERPRTNAELQYLCIDHSAAIARDMNKLIRAGVAKIIAGGGRGHPATYALRGDQ